jgi:hypothetical protein
LKYFAILMDLLKKTGQVYELFLNKKRVKFTPADGFADWHTRFGANNARLLTGWPGMARFILPSTLRADKTGLPRLGKPRKTGKLWLSGKTIVST